MITMGSRKNDKQLLVPAELHSKLVEVAQTLSSLMTEKIDLGFITSVSVTWFLSLSDEQKIEQLHAWRERQKQAAISVLKKRKKLLDDL